MKDIELWCGDCLELMKDIPDGSVDLILCDLPYGVTQNKADLSLPLDLLWKEYNRVVKDNAAVLLFAQGLFYIDLVQSNKKNFRYDLIWNKRLTSGFLNAKRMPLRQHEQVAVFYKKLPTYNPIFSVGAPLHGKGHSYKDKDIVNNNYGKFGVTDDVRKGETQKYPTSILSFDKPHPSISKHRTEKPAELLEYLVKTYSNPGDTVLDNTMGSGSTGVACVNTGRKFIGIELDPEYFKIAEERILSIRKLS